MATASGTFVYDDAGGEQTLKELTIPAETEIGAIYLDLSLVSAGCLLRCYTKINDMDGYRHIGGTVKVPLGSTIDEGLNLLNYMENAGQFLGISSGKLSVDTDFKITIEPIPA
jgi:hypothetical protein